jgi:hypothetical protein
VKILHKSSILAAVMALFTACGGSTFELFPDTETSPAANTAPVANAGSAQNVIVSDIVLLNGSGSSDANGDPLTYTWTLTRPTGSAAALSSTTAVDPFFTADVTGAYILNLTVSDGKISSAPATVTITAYASPPTADAGPDQSGIIAGTTVTLDGSASIGANLSYTWRFTAKPDNAGSVVLADATVVNPTFTPTLAGTYVIELIVKDRLVSSQPDTVTVTVVPANTGSITVTW